MPDRSLKALVTLSVVLGVAEIADTVVIMKENYKDSFPEGAVAFGLFFLLGAWLLRRRRVTIGAVRDVPSRSSAPTPGSTREAGLRSGRPR
ncbi:MAG: PEP-CTERM sorting domain-containing protein [Nocardioidaceae bacterium]